MDRLCAAYDIRMTDEEYSMYERYTGMLLEKNKVMNLTRITEPEQVSEKHILDSLLIFRYGIVGENKSVIDVGTGAGFPGVVMKIHTPSLEITLLDSLRKRIDFLKEVSENTYAMNCIHSRAEDAGRGEMRESFDIACARAVAAFPVLCEYCLPLVKVGGVFISMKGPGEDIDTSVVSVYGGEVVKDERYTLPCGDERRIITVKKTAETPKKYPRRKI
ncbi:MAG: 16S rRNA (guanine(527)-N(7))-methyltransferase RsmG [Oscillospiraceae bacterium]|nr:16S rRNA (guanine(527)-N(7))-methyltransferase RsmG [Oscillospiraceae bacterium]